jgi:hypothetical protein
VECNRNVLVFEVNPEIRFGHCPIHCEANVAKILPNILKSIIIHEVTKMNFKLQSLNSRLFSVCRELDFEYISFLLHMEIQWLLCREVLTFFFFFFNFTTSCKIFNAQENRYTQLLADDEWIAELAYMSDIFIHLNKLKRKMQGKIENIKRCMDIIQGFQGKLKL